MEEERAVATEEQISANRRNAQRSTGPKTAQGKAAIRRNALKHGVLSREALLPDEDATALAELSKGVLGALQPVGELEICLVDRVITGLWRLRRLGRVETGLFVSHVDKAEGESLRDLPTLSRAFMWNAGLFSTLSGYESAIERGIFKALHELERLQAARSGQLLPPPVAADVDITLSMRGDAAGDSAKQSQSGEG